MLFCKFTSFHDDNSCRSFRPPVLTHKPTPQLTHLPTPSSRAARFWTTVMYHNLVGIPIPSVKKGAEVLLYQYKICPFCNSVKALLHHQNIPYSSVEVNPLTKSQLGWSKEYKKVPVAVFQDGEVVNDSAQIMDAVLARSNGGGDANASFAGPEAMRWSSWAKDSLAVNMYPNMTRSFAECRDTLAYFSDTPGISPLDALLVQTVGALGMSFAHGKIKQKYGIEDERAALAARLDEWVAELASSSSSGSDKRGGAFRGGSDAPDVGDLSVYGVLNCARDVPLFEDIASHGDGRLKAWIDEMDRAVPAPRVVP